MRGQGRADRVERRDQRRSRHHQDQHAAGGNVPGAGARHARLHRRGQGQLLSLDDEAAHRELGVRRDVADDAAEGDDPLLLHRAGCDADPGGDQERREGHRVCRHRQRHAVGVRRNGASRKSTRCRRQPAGAGAIEPRRQRPRHADRRIRRAGRHPERHAEPAEGAHPADAGADEDERSEGTAKNLRRFRGASSAADVAIRSRPAPTRRRSRCRRSQARARRTTPSCGAGGCRSA